MHHSGLLKLGRRFHPTILDTVTAVWEWCNQGKDGLFLAKSLPFLKRLHNLEKISLVTPASLFDLGALSCLNLRTVFVSCVENQSLDLMPLRLLPDLVTLCLGDVSSGYHNLEFLSMQTLKLQGTPFGSSLSLTTSLQRFVTDDPGCTPFLAALTQLSRLRLAGWSDASWEAEKITASLEHRAVCRVF